MRFLFKKRGLKHPSYTTFLPTKTLIRCNRRKHNFIYELLEEKKNCENQKKINRHLVMSRTSLAIKHVEIGRRINGTLRLSYKNPNFLQDLTRFFQKGRVIAKSRLTSNETSYLYGRLTPHLRYVQGCLNH